LALCLADRVGRTPLLCSHLHVVDLPPLVLPARHTPVSKSRAQTPPRLRHKPADASRQECKLEQERDRSRGFVGCPAPPRLCRCHSTRTIANVQPYRGPSTRRTAPSGPRARQVTLRAAQSRNGCAPFFRGMAPWPAPGMPLQGPCRGEKKCARCGAQGLVPCACGAQTASAAWQTDPLASLRPRSRPPRPLPPYDSFQGMSTN